LHPDRTAFGVSELTSVRRWWDQKSSTTPHATRCRLIDRKRRKTLTRTWVLLRVNAKVFQDSLVGRQLIWRNELLLRRQPTYLGMETAWLVYNGILSNTARVEGACVEEVPRRKLASPSKNEPTTIPRLMPESRSRMTVGKPQSYAQSPRLPFARHS
jgi:hypothetical protein